MYNLASMLLPPLFNIDILSFKYFLYSSLSFFVFFLLHNILVFRERTCPKLFNPMMNINLLLKTVFSAQAEEKSKLKYNI